MSDAVERRDRLAEFSGERGSMVLVTERRRAIPAMQCEICKVKHDGGIARGVVLDESGSDTPWVRWVLPDGFSFAEHSDIAVCSKDQCDPLIRTLRFAE